MENANPFVRISIDQLAQLIRQITQSGSDLSENDLPPGTYEVTESEVAFTATVQVVIPQDQNRWGILFGQANGGAFRYGFSNTITTTTGFNPSSNSGSSDLVGRRWREFVRRDIFGVSTAAPGTITVAQLLRV